MSAAREMTQADFDLERFIEMFDEALTSNDERVINALRSLMMMVILTKPEGRKNTIGPLRQLFDDLHNLNRRMHSMEDTIRQMEYQYRREREYEEELKRSDMWPPRAYNATYSAAMTDELYKIAMETLSVSPAPSTKTKP